MQEEVENRTLTLVVSGTKFTGRLLKAAISKYMAHCKEKKLQKQRSRDAPVTPHGKQTVKQLIGQNQGISNISENVPVSIEDSFFAADPLSCKRAFTDFAALFLCHSSHNGQPQLAITVKSPNVIIHKIDFNPYGGELANTDQCIYRISGKAADLASDNQIEFLLFGILHHPHKGIPLIDLSSGNALVGCCTERTNNFTPYRTPGARFPAEIQSHRQGSAGYPCARPGRW